MLHQQIKATNHSESLRITPADLLKLTRALATNLLQQAELSGKISPEAFLLKKGLEDLHSLVKEKPLLSNEDLFCLVTIFITLPDEFKNQVEFCLQFLETLGMKKFAESIRSLLKKKSPLSFENFLTQFSLFSPIPIAPDQIAMNDFTEDGKLNVPPEEQKLITSAIHQKIEEKKFSERITKKHFQNKTLTYSTEFIYDEKTGERIFEGYVYKGKKQNCHVGAGAFGKLKVLMRKAVLTDIWYVLKLQEPRASTANEFKTASKLALALTKLDRYSFTHKRWQEEIVMQWIPGESLRKIHADSPRKLHPIFWMKILLHMCEAVLKLHKAGWVHRDIKTENFMVFGTDVKLIDVGFTIEGETYKGKVLSDLKGTFGCIHPKTVKTYTWDHETDIYALGIAMMEVLNLITPASQQKSDSMPNTHEAMVEFSNWGGYQLRPANDATFQANQILPQPVLRDVRNFINRMIAKAEPVITTAETCVQFFKAQCERKEMQSLPVQTAVINVTEYLAADLKTQQSMVTKAGNYDAIQFVHSGKRPTPKQYIGLWRTFDKSRKAKLEATDLGVTDMSNLEERLTKLNPEPDINRHYTRVKP